MPNNSLTLQSTTFYRATKETDTFTTSEVEKMVGCGVNAVAPEQLFWGLDAHAAQVWAWEAGEPGGNGDCARWENGLLNDKVCSYEYAYACKNRDGEWKITDTRGAWSGGASACNSLDVDSDGIPDGYVFAVPENGYDNNKLKEKYTYKAWVNYTDKVEEGVWLPGDDMAELYAPLTEGKEYIIVNVGRDDVTTNKILSIAPDGNGNYGYNRSNVLVDQEFNGESYQMWTLDYVGFSNGHVYRILNGVYGKALDVQGQQTANGTNVQLYSASNTQDNQKWTISAVDTDSNIYKVIGVQSGAALDVDVLTDLNNVQIWSYGDGGNQQWRFFSKEFCGAGTYAIVSERDQTALSVANNNPGDSVNVKTASLTFDDSQLWDVVEVSTGVYKIFNHDTNYALQVEGASTLDAANVEIYSSQETWDRQKWLIIDRVFSDSDGATYTASVIYNFNSIKLLDVATSGSTYYYNVQQYGTNENYPQRQWHFYGTCK